MDSVSGMYWLKTRWYSPYLKRFVSPDRLFIAGDALTAANMYAYCNGNPVNLWDPSGMDAIVLYHPNILFGVMGHMGLLVQDSKENWWYFLFGRSGISRVNMTDNSGKLKVNSFNSLNKEVYKNTGFESNYQKSVYLKGNYTKTFDYCMDKYNKYKSTGINTWKPASTNCSYNVINALAKSNSAILYAFSISSIAVRAVNPSVPNTAFALLRAMYPSGHDKWKK